MFKAKTSLIVGRRISIHTRKSFDFEMLIVDMDVNVNAVFIIVCVT